MTDEIFEKAKEFCDTMKECNSIIFELSNTIQAPASILIGMKQYNIDSELRSIIVDYYRKKNSLARDSFSKL